jgi:hypothetical protein
VEESDNLFTADQVHTGNSSVRSIVSEEARNLESTPLVSQGLSEAETDTPHQPSITLQPQELTGKEAECLSGNLSVIMELIAACDERDLLSEVRIPRSTMYLLVNLVARPHNLFFADRLIKMVSSKTSRQWAERTDRASNGSRGRQGLCRAF